MTSLSTRRAGLGDIAAVARLFDAYRQFYDMQPDYERARDYVQARIKNSESVIFVAEDHAGEIVGFCQLYPTFCSVLAAPIYTLYDLFVAPEARKSGSGKALLAAAEDHAAETGAARMDLQTAKANVPAQALYSSSGWTRGTNFYAYSKVPARRAR